MTTGEMAQWTRRLHSILEGPADIQNERLETMQEDIMNKHGVFVTEFGQTVIFNPFAVRLYQTVQEWREV